MLVPLGGTTGITIGAAIPGPASALTIASAQFTAQSAAYASFQPVVNPPTFSVDVALAADISASVGAAMSAGLTPPSISVQADIMLAAVAAIKLQLDAMLAITDLFVSAGLFLYSYTGPVNLFADQLSGALESLGSTEFCTGLVMVTKVAATASAMGTVFKMS
jgi:hypothetical protein